MALVIELKGNLVFLSLFSSDFPKLSFVDFFLPSSSQGQMRNFLLTYSFLLGPDLAPFPFFLALGFLVIFISSSLFFSPSLFSDFSSSLLFSDSFFLSSSFFLAAAAVLIGDSRRR